MRNKIFRLNQNKKYRNRVIKMAHSDIPESRFNEDKLHGMYKWVDSYKDLIERISHLKEKNRKRCGCMMCRNQRKNKFLSKKHRRTLSENKFHDKASQEIKEYFDEELILGD